MTPFFSRELSQALQEAGCVNGEVGHGNSPDAKWYWMKNVGKPCLLIGFRSILDDVECMAFHPWDLCGGSERARENAKIYMKLTHPGLSSDYFINLAAKVFRHTLIDLPEEEQEAYVWKTMRKVG